MAERCVVLLGGRGVSTRMVHRALRAALPSNVRLEVIIEEPVPRRQLLKRRLRRLGPVTVVGQVLFMAIVVPLLRRAGRRRVDAIIREHGLDDASLPPSSHHVPSANSDQARALLRALSPDVVVVNGTRILRRETLACAPVPFINTHAGITPTFRGVHGGYWALATGRPELVGTTVHRVDEGIDTGAIIEQTRFEVTIHDSFWTYPYLHTAAGLPPLIRAVEAALAGTLDCRQTDPALASALWYHPTLWGYLARRILRGVH